MSGLMVALSWTRSLVSLLQMLGSLLTSPRTAGVVGGGVMLIVFALRMKFKLAGACAPFLGLCSLFRQSFSAVHLGVDNLGVVRHVGRLLYGHHGSLPFELVKDGDLLLLVDWMLRLRGLDTVRVTKVKGHADEAEVKGHADQGMVLDGRVRELDRLGNDAADEAAGFGRRRVGNAVIDARRNLSAVCGRLYPVLLDLHRFFIAISRAVVNHDGRNDTAPDPLVWSAGAPQEASAGSRGSAGILNGLVCLHPLSVLMTLLIGPTLQVFWSSVLSFSGTLHWPAGGLDLGVGVSYV